MEALNPTVWCDCYRDTLPLAWKVQGGSCTLCRCDAGESAHDELTLQEVATLQALYEALESQWDDLDAEAEDLMSEVFRIENEKDDLADEMSDIETKLRRAGVVL